MNITLVQFERTLRKVMRDETKHLATKKQVEDLIVKVNSLVKIIDSCLEKKLTT